MQEMGKLTTNLKQQDKKLMETSSQMGLITSMTHSQLLKRFERESK